MTKDERFALIYSAAANFAAEGRFPFDLAIKMALDMEQHVLNVLGDEPAKKEVNRA